MLLLLMNPKVYLIWDEVFLWCSYLLLGCVLVYKITANVVTFCQIVISAVRGLFLYYGNIIVHAYALKVAMNATFVRQKERQKGN